MSGSEAHPQTDGGAFKLFSTRPVRASRNISTQGAVPYCNTAATRRRGWPNSQFEAKFQVMPELNTRRLTVMKLASIGKASARIAVGGMALLAVVALAPQVRAEDWTKSYSISGRANVHVETNDGSVQVYTGDSKQVEFRVIYEGYEMNRTLHVDSRQNGDEVEVTARVSGHWGFNWNGHGRRMKIEVRMPKDADLNVNTGDGSVETQSISGRLKVHTGDGSVRAQS